MSSREQPMKLIFSSNAQTGNEFDLLRSFVDVCGSRGCSLGLSGAGALSQFLTFAQANAICKHLNAAEWDVRREIIVELPFTYVYVPPQFVLVPPTPEELKALTIAHDKMYQRNNSIIKICAEIVAWIHDHMTPEQVKEMNGETNLRTYDYRVQGNLFFRYLNKCLDRTVLALDKQIALPIADVQLASTYVSVKEAEINRLDAITGEATTDRQKVNICTTGLLRRFDVGGSMNAAYEIFVDGILKLNRTKMSITLAELQEFINRWEIQHPLVATVESVMGVNAVSIPLPPAPLGAGKSKNALKRAARKAKAAIAAGAPAAAPAPAPLPPAAKFCTGCNKAGHLEINCFGNPDNENLTILQIKAKR